MLKKRRKEREDDDDEACERIIIIIMYKTLCINILAICVFVIAAQSFSHLVI